MLIKSNLLPPQVQSFSSSNQQLITALPEIEKERPASSLQELREKQQKDMKESLSQLETLRESNNPKRIATQRAAQLKQRLESLKIMMARLPPGNYKALAQELKKIAKELAALGKELGYPAGGQAHMPAQAASPNAAASAEPVVSGLSADSAATPAEAVASSEASLAAKEAAAQAQQATTESNPENTVDGHDNQGGQEQPKAEVIAFATTKTHQESDDQALRTTLADAGKLLKQVASLLKAKHQPDDKETRAIFSDIERELEQLDRQLRTSPFPAAMALTDVPVNISTGGFVDTSV